jgi:glycosyltransferase involved in cell wall biosynthesis
LLTFASTAARNKYLEGYPKSSRSRLLPYFTHSRQWCIDSRRAAELRAKYDIALSDRILVYFGRLCPEKNITDLLEVFAKCSRPGVVLLIVGTPSDVTTFGFRQADLHGYQERLAATIGRMERVRFAGSPGRDELQELVAISYLVLNLTLCFEEDFGFSSIEASSAGVPVICSDWGGLKDTVVHGETGYRARTRLLDQGRAELDTGEAARYLELLLDDENLRNRLAENGQRRARAEYSEGVFVARLRSIVQEAISNDAADNHLDSFGPAPWIEPMYRRALESRTSGSIYDDDNLFRRLYRHYASQVETD